MSYIRGTCPICGGLRKINGFEKTHKFPRMIETTSGGRGKLFHEEINDEFMLDDFTEIVIEKCITFLESQGYIVKKR